MRVSMKYNAAQTVMSFSYGEWKTILSILVVQQLQALQLLKLVI
jgi:phage-related holin